MEETAGWPWLLGGVPALLVFAAGGFLWWRRRASEQPRAVPRIERPRVPPVAPGATTRSESPGPARPAALRSTPAAPTPEARALTAEADPLQVSLETRRVSITLVAGSLAYRVTVANAGSEPLNGIAIAGDMVSAHASLAEEAQRAGPATSLSELHRIERLEPGEERTVEGEFRLPFSAMRVIRQGSAALFVPLVRFRVAAEGMEPVTATRAVGLPPQHQGGGLQPFRLDLGPRNYSPLAQRAF